jgi:catechol 2,3-dioxygenase-like lactoylglutathione lyase family enzyme
MDLNHLNLPVRDPAACRDFYQRHFGFQPAFEAEGGYFLRNERGFLLALLPAASDQPFRDGFHVGFGVGGAGDVLALWKRLSAAGVRTIHPEDFRPAEAYLTFRCWDPDGTEVEVFWQGP